MASWALVDCNSFYASCEQLFRPDLQGRAVIVLSNNDGCVVARSLAAKRLGIPMGEPVFRLRRLIREQGVVVFSSNYTLYADLSARVMTVLESLVPAVAVYSIDEAWCELSGFQDREAWGREAQSRVAQWVGIPVGVGIGPTKTLAKLANYTAKRWRRTGGVVDLTPAYRRKSVMPRIPVNEVWGVGGRLAKRLSVYGIRTVADLMAADPRVLRREGSVMLERTVRELQGVPCYGFEDDAESAHEQVVCSRSFGERITELRAMHQAVATYTQTAAARLRDNRRLAQTVSVFIRTSFFADVQHADQAAVRLVRPSADTRVLLAVTRKLLHSIWKADYRYAKAGVMLGELVSDRHRQGELFAETGQRVDNPRLMAAVDRINASPHGRVWFAAQGRQHHWAMRRDQLSPAYTTRWSNLPRVN